MKGFVLKNISVPDSFMQQGMSNQRNEQISLARTSAAMLSLLFRRRVDNTLSMYKGTDDNYEINQQDATIQVMYYS